MERNFVLWNEIQVNRGFSTEEKDSLFPSIPHHMPEISQTFAAMQKNVKEMHEQVAKINEQAMQRMRGAISDRNVEVGLYPKTIQGKDGKPAVKWDFDVKGFKPEEICIKTTNNCLEVSAKRATKTETSEESAEFSRVISMPSGVQLEQMKSLLGENGVLSVEAPINEQKAIGSVREIPIIHEEKKN